MNLGTFLVKFRNKKHFLYLRTKVENLGTLLVKSGDRKRFFYLGTKVVNLGTFLVKFEDTLNRIQLFSTFGLSSNMLLKFGIPTMFV